MFYSFDILGNRKGRFALVWLAATQVRKLRKPECLKFDIVKACDDVVNSIPSERGTGKRKFSLYLCSQLMYGVSVLHKEQYKYLMTDVEELRDKLRNKPKRGRKSGRRSEIDLSPARARPARNKVDLPSVDLSGGFAFPPSQADVLNLDHLDAMVAEGTRGNGRSSDEPYPHVARFEDITLAEEPKEPSRFSDFTFNVDPDTGRLLDDFGEPLVHGNGQPAFDDAFFDVNAAVAAAPEEQPAVAQEPAEPEAPVEQVVVIDDPYAEQPAPPPPTAPPANAYEELELLPLEHRSPVAGPTRRRRRGRGLIVDTETTISRAEMRDGMQPENYMQLCVGVEERVVVEGIRPRIVYGKPCIHSVATDALYAELVSLPAPHHTPVDVAWLEHPWTLPKPPSPSTSYDSDEEEERRRAFESPIQYEEEEPPRKRVRITDQPDELIDAAPPPHEQQEEQPLDQDEAAAAAAAAAEESVELARAGANKDSLGERTSELGRGGRARPSSILQDGGLGGAAAIFEDTEPTVTGEALFFGADWLPADDAAERGRAPPPQPPRFVEMAEDEQPQRYELRKEALLKLVEEGVAEESSATVAFSSLCPPPTTRRIEAAKTFSILLDLMKKRKVAATQAAPYDEIFVSLV